MEDEFHLALSFTSKLSTSFLTDIGLLTTIYWQYTIELQLSKGCILLFVKQYH